MSPTKAVRDTGRIGITLVTGFLGSGKSTLIRRILTEQHNLRIVVIENEFADNAIVEKAIVTQGLGSNSVQEFIELPNGCICCAAQDDLTDALMRLVDKKMGAFDHILVEASGLADPAPVAASLWVDDFEDSPLRLDAVVTIADAANIERYLNGDVDEATTTIAEKQLAVADIVLLNKIDMLQTNAASHPDHSPTSSSAEAERISRLVGKYGSARRVIPTIHCAFDLSEMLDVRAYESEVAERSLIHHLPMKFSAAGHSHGANVNTVSLTFRDDIFNGRMLDRALGQLLWEELEPVGKEGTPVEIWRLKALVRVEHEHRKRIYQGVHTLFDQSESSVDANHDGGVSRFVFIGRGLLDEQIKEIIGQAVASSPQNGDEGNG